jgi:Fe-S-cluster containining protein
MLILIVQIKKMENILRNLPKLAAEKRAETKRYFTRLKKKNPKRLDILMQDLHNKEFEKIDCLSCANCCKTSSPIFTNKDIARIAKHFKMKERDFIDQYLLRDEDDFMVLQEAPCAFLCEDNSCSIYNVRPKACSEYPHTNRKKFIQLTSLTLKNTEICPAVFNIVEDLKKKFPL